MKFLFSFSSVVLLLISSAQDVNAAIEHERSFPKTRMVQVDQVDLNFSFEKERQDFFYDQASWENLWKENSRIIPAPTPEIDIDWEREVVLMLAWPGEFSSKDNFASFLSTRIEKLNEDDKVFQIKVVLTEPCFAMMTDRSPVIFLAFDQDDLLFNQFSLETIKAEQTGCDPANPLPAFGK